ncbi:MAG: hypothetical protein U5K75_12050 [Ahrensia sp.]|nr:hypothetical protein [Ahrensia sp.]
MSFTRGNSFDMSGTLNTLFDGQIVTDFTGWSAYSQLRKINNDLISDLSIEWLSRSPGIIRVYSTGATSGWPLGMSKMDVVVTSPTNFKISTSVAFFEIVEGATSVPSGG